MSRIEQIIEELDEFIASCKAVPLSSTKIYVNKEEIEEYINELRLKTPDEIKKYQKLISNKDAIIKDAKEQANQMIQAAKAQTAELVSEHEIMQQAYEQANKVIAEATEKAQNIVDRATEDANNIRMGSLQYTDDMLANLQLIMEHAIENTRMRYDALFDSLDKNLNIVVSNRNELRPADASKADGASTEQELAANVKDVMDDDGPTGEEENINL